MDANGKLFFTDLQQKLLKIIIDGDKDPRSLFVKEDEKEEWENVCNYFKMLLIEKSMLERQGKALFAIHLIEEEIRHLFMSPISPFDIDKLEMFNQNKFETLANDNVVNTESSDSIMSDDEEITLTQSVLIPVDDYPTYNFIGRIIGPRGMTAKQLEKDTGCRIMIRGSYSNKTYGYSQRQNGNGDFVDESISPLRVVIRTTGRRADANSRINEALRVVKSLLVPPPDGRDELKRRQLLELAIMNGTYRPATSVISSDQIRSDCV